MDKICCECGDGRITEIEQDYDFPYGVGNFVILTCKVPVMTCLNCGFEWLDCRAEERMDKKIEEYKNAGHTN